MAQSAQANGQHLAQHTLQYAQAVREFGKRLPMTVANVEDLKQLIRASGAIGATYIAAHEASSREDFCYHIKLAGQEAQATQYWLQLVDLQGNPALAEQRERLVSIAADLSRIFAQILQSSVQA